VALPATLTFLDTDKLMSLDEMLVMDGDRASMLDRIIHAVVGYRVERGEQWLTLSKNMPGVVYFATDLDPRSFEKDESQGTWLGRAELLLKAPAEVRPGQVMLEVSFTLPVRVLMSEQNGALSIEAFDFYSAEENEAPKPYYDPDDGPPKTIGWGPFEGLV
jgi:hypothetical protein